MIRELSYEKSIEFIKHFESLEQPNIQGMDWTEIYTKDAKYIWFLELDDMIEKPLGFLSYTKYILYNQINFLYIVKIYVLKTHCQGAEKNENPILINGKKVSEILFEKIDEKDINILTLESASDNLDVHYRKLGFKYNTDISIEFSSRIDTKGRKIMYRRKEEISLTEAERNMFGDL